MDGAVLCLWNTPRYNFLNENINRDQYIKNATPYTWLIETCLAIVFHIMKAGVESRSGTN